MPFVGWKYRGKIIPHAQALAHAKEHGHWQHLPVAVLRRLARVDRSPYRLSPSQLTRCIRQGVLRQREDYALDVKSELRMARGSAWHHYLDERIPGQSEQLLTTTIAVDDDRAITLEGTMDYYEPETRTIIDYKTTSVLRYYDRLTRSYVDKELITPEYELQINAYALLCEDNDMPVDRAFLSYFAGDNSVKTVQVEVWPTDVTRLVVQEFAARMLYALECAPGLPAPIPLDHDDAWQCKYCPVAERCRELEQQGE